MVWQFGMGKSGYIGNFQSLNGNQNQPSSLSDSMKDRLNEDVQDILQSARKEVENLLKEDDEVFEKLVKEILEKEELEYDEIDRIFKEYDAKRAAEKGGR